jgi:hypothetical protein
MKRIAILLAFTLAALAQQPEDFLSAEEVAQALAGNGKNIRLTWCTILVTLV